jgi:hypothetical protein
MIAAIVAGSISADASRTRRHLRDLCHDTAAKTENDTVPNGVTLATNTSQTALIDSTSGPRAWPCFRRVKRRLMLGFQIMF